MRATVQSQPLGAALRLLDRALIGAALFFGMLLIGVQLARATEVIPSVGITRSVNTDDDTAKMSGGLALRSDLAPFLMGEIGASYRNEERFGGDLHIKQWPITASGHVPLGSVAGR